MKIQLVQMWPLAGGNYCLPNSTILERNDAGEWTALFPQQPGSIGVIHPIPINLPADTLLPIESVAMDQAGYNRLFELYGGMAHRLLYNRETVVPRGPAGT